MKKFPKLRNAIFAILTVVISITVISLMCEMGIRVYFYSKNGFSNTSETLREETRFKFLKALGSVSECSWFDTLYPHPNLGYVQHNISPCGWETSNLLLYGDDLPWSKGQYFVVLSLGGSVAQQVVSTFPPYKKNWIELYLNAKYHSPNGKPFKVVNGAMGGWKQPNQVTMLMANIQRIDAFVSLEGFNEAIAIQGGKRIEMPVIPFFSISQLPDLPHAPFVFLTKTNKLISGNELLKNSFLFITLYQKVRDILGANYEKNLQRTLLTRSFDYPNHFGPEEKIEMNKSQYLNYVRLMDSIGLTFGKPSSFFLQPIPNLHKKLHANDWPPRKGVITKLYQDLERDLLAINTKSMKIHSLTTLYQNVEDWIYCDEIHACVGPAGYSKGYDLMGQAIADGIAKDWKLKRKE